MFDLSEFIKQYYNPTKHQRTRELIVKEYLDNNGLEYISYDKSTANSKICGRFRPDFVFEANTHYVILECDEKQHENYDKDCEIKRMLMIAQGLGFPTYFIIFNPDTYKESSKTVRTPLKKRMKLCKKTIKHYINSEPPESAVFVKYLYYDDMHNQEQTYNIF